LASSAAALPPGYAKRPADASDIPALARVHRSRDDAYGIDPENVVPFFTWLFGLPFVDLSRDTVVVTAGEEPAAFALATRDPASAGDAFRWFGVVAHDHAGRSLGTWLVEWAHRLVDERREREGDFIVRSTVPVEDEDGRRLIERAGYRHVRTSWDMARRLDAAEDAGEPPEGVAIRRFVEGRDERVFWEVTEAAFAEHFAHSPTPYESFEGEWYNSSDWNADRVLLAETEGEVVGALGWVEASPEGYIPTVGVLPEHRKRGIATALLRRAFADIAAAGFSRAGLSVDAANTTGAVELYRKVGMEPVREALIYERQQR
jgi:ribosomal protein S18 acetylase RimI-like enzyme